MPSSDDIERIPAPTGDMRLYRPAQIGLGAQLKAAQALNDLLAGGEMPLAVMLRRMRGDPTVTETMFEAAVKAAPYVHARRSSVRIQHERNDNPQNWSDAELVAYIDAERGPSALEAPGNTPELPGMVPGGAIGGRLEAGPTPVALDPRTVGPGARRNGSPDDPDATGGGQEHLF